MYVHKQLIALDTSIFPIFLVDQNDSQDDAQIVNTKKQRMLATEVNNSNERVKIDNVTKGIESTKEQIGEKSINDQTYQPTIVSGIISPRPQLEEEKQVGKPSSSSELQISVAKDKKMCLHHNQVQREIYQRKIHRTNKYRIFDS